MPFTVLVTFDFVSSGDNVIVNELNFLPTHELVKDLFGFFYIKRVLLR
jgi:glutathione synthase/RimK-type ligase-like ATP-grasp enzyme